MAKMILNGEPGNDRMQTIRLLFGEKRADYLLRGAATVRQSPSLEHGHVALYDIRAITRYVDSVFGGIPLFPRQDDSDRLTDRWIAWVDGQLRPVLVHREPGGERLHSCAETIRRAIADRDYLCGSAPSLADFYLFPALDRLMRAVGCASASRELRRYHETMSMRESVWTLPLDRKGKHDE